MSESWTFPEYLEPYRDVLTQFEWSCEELIHEFHSNLNIFNQNIEKMQAAFTIIDEIRLLERLHQRRLLRDLSSWECKTPYPESNNFCGGPHEHPVFWGCGYQKVGE